MTRPAPKKSDLGVRTISAIVMVAVAGTALWLGGWVWNAFVGLLALAVLYEWTRLFLAFTSGFGARIVWALGGAVYVGLSAFILVLLRSPFYGVGPLLLLIAVVIAIDVGAYFAGRTFGGPKIAPKISPSKTWSGLCGGILGACIVIFFRDGCIVENPVGVFEHWRICVGANGYALSSTPILTLAPLLLIGTCATIAAQSGDFFESWMKRRAGVKDSGALIPGHGGVFDRVDGLLAVLFVVGIIVLSMRFLAA